MPIPSRAVLGCLVLQLSACAGREAIDQEPGSSSGDPGGSTTTGLGAAADGSETTTGSTSPDSSGGEAPSCDDGLRNGEEEDIDCGGSCQPCAPAQWTCDAQFYGDGVCQCGCAVSDVDCDSDDIDACAYALCPDGQALVPGQTLECTEVPALPPAWACAPTAFGDSECDCGCEVLDFDCVDASVSSCAHDRCADAFEVDPDDNAQCLPPPADAVDNPSFEAPPANAGDVPGWTLLDDIGGFASVGIDGMGQTSAPDGVQALVLESTNDGLVGARTVRSSPFLPPAGMCTVTVAVGDSNEDSEYTDFGQIRVRAPAKPDPLDLVAEVDIDNRGMGGISPPTSGYVDATLSFVADGTSLYHVEIRVMGSFGTLSYHADHVRIACAS